VPARVADERARASFAGTREHELAVAPREKLWPIQAGGGDRLADRDVVVAVLAPADAGGDQRSS
jgi:hypothetical protein